VHSDTHGASLHEDDVGGLARSVCTTETSSMLQSTMLQSISVRSQVRGLMVRIEETCSSPTCCKSDVLTGSVRCIAGRRTIGTTIVLL
jgi:hypothetical protein